MAGIARHKAAGLEHWQMTENLVVRDQMGDPGLAVGLAGKSVVVTGGGGGIGFAISELLVGLGANVALWDVSEAVTTRASSLTGDASSHGRVGRALGLVVDVTSREAADRAMSLVASEFGGVDVLVHSAGVALLGAAESLQMEQWDATLRVNLSSAFLVAQSAFPYLKVRGGRIINIASQAATVAIKHHAAYCASKAGLVGLTKVLAVEWGEHGITANCVSPTVVMTELGRKAWTGQRRADALGMIPMGRFAEPNEVAACVAFLASSQAAMVNGADLLVDGGWTAQ